MQSDATFTARVYSARHRPSPLMQRGLEIPLVVDVEWDDTSKLDIFRERVDKVGYSVDTPYSDQATEILKEILPPDLQGDENGDYSDLDGEDDAIINDVEEAGSNSATNSEECSDNDEDALLRVNCSKKENYSRTIWTWTWAWTNCHIIIRRRGQRMRKELLMRF